MEGGKNTNYWPGFVDALGNTIIAMVFVVIVLAISLSMYVKLLAQRQAERIVVEKLAELQAKGPVSGVGGGGEVRSTSKSQRGVTTSEAPGGGHAIPTEVVQARDSLGKSDPSMPDVRETGGAIEVVYGREAFELIGASKERFRELVLKVRQATGHPAIAITIFSPDMQFTEEQRHAYLRAMILRNELIDLGYEPRLVSVRSRVGGADGEPMTARLVAMPQS